MGNKCCCTQDFPVDGTPEMINAAPALSPVKGEVRNGLDEHIATPTQDDANNLEAEAEQPAGHKVDEQPRCVYDCVLERDSSVPWGMEFDPMHPYLQVTEVTADGVVEKFNSTSDTSIEKDDLIVRVNGIEAAPQKMLSIIQHEGTTKLELQMARPQKLDVTIEREAGQPWGLNVEYQSKLNGMLVKSVKDSSVIAGKLFPSDLILSINDIAGHPTKMRDAIKTENTIKMSVLRINRHESDRAV